MGFAAAPPAADGRAALMRVVVVVSGMPEQVVTLRDGGCNPMRRRLQPHAVTEAATPCCNGGCNPARWRLQPDDGVVGHARKGAGGGEVEEDARERPTAKAHGDLVRVRARARAREQHATTRVY